MESNLREQLRRPEVRRQIVQLFTISLIVTGASLAFLSHFLGSTSIDWSERQFKCWRCLFSVAAAGPEHGVAVGEGQQLLQLSDGAWQWEAEHATTGDDFLDAAAVTPQGDSWVVGSAIVHYHDGTWTQEKTLGDSAESLSSVVALSPSDVWAVGGSWYNTLGIVLHYDGISWSLVHSFPMMNFTSVSVPAPNIVVVGGARYADENNVSEGVLLRYQNGAWTQELSTPSEIRSVVMTSPNEGWALASDGAGGTTFYRYASETWLQASEAAHIWLSGLSFTSADEGWAIGSTGDQSVVYHFDHGSWSLVALPAGLHAFSVTSVGRESALILGSSDIPNSGGWQRGVVLRYQNGRWTTLTIPKKPALTTADAINEYLMPGFAIFCLPLLFWLLWKSLRAPQGSQWRHWIARTSIIAGFAAILGVLLPSAVPLTTGDIPVNPDLLINAGAAISLVGALIAGTLQVTGLFVKAVQVYRKSSAASSSTTGADTP